MAQVLWGPWNAALYLYIPTVTLYPLLQQHPSRVSLVPTTDQSVQSPRRLSLESFKPNALFGHFIIESFHSIRIQISNSPKAFRATWILTTLLKPLMLLWRERDSCTRVWFLQRLLVSHNNSLFTSPRSNASNLIATSLQDYSKCVRGFTILRL
jgi:hypothetical protein